MCGWGLLNTCTCASTFDTTSCIRGHHVYKNVWTPTLGDKLECRKGDNDFDRYAVAVLRRGVVVGHLPRLPLTSTLWHCWIFLLTSLSSFADRRVQSFSSGSIVSLALLQHGDDHMWFCTIFLIFGFNIDQFKFTPPNHQSFFSANISGYTYLSGSFLRIICEK